MLQGYQCNVENPAALTPIPHTNLALNDSDARGSILMGFAVCKLFANQKNRVSANTLKPLSVLAPPAGLEPATL
jgi:hypothetical protein